MVIKSTNPERGCMNCLHKYKIAFDEPCFSCTVADGLPHWEENPEEL